jgi:hypothetical protein
MEVELVDQRVLKTMLHTEWQAIPAASSVMRRNMERQVEECSNKVGTSDAIDMELKGMMEC